MNIPWSAATTGYKKGPERRDPTRLRVSLLQDQNRMQNHMEKVLEDANLKLGCVVTDTPLGVSEQNIIRAVIAGDKDRCV